MHYDRQAYLRENTDDAISGIVVIETDESDGYRITENRDDGWCKPFWMPADQLLSHDTEHVGQLSSDQYMRVCQACGIN